MSNYVYTYTVNGRIKYVFDDSKKAALHAINLYPNDEFTKEQIKDFIEPPPEEQGVTTRIEWYVGDDPNNDRLDIERHEVK